MKRFQTFIKRPGTTDKGKHFENILVAKLILDLLKDEGTYDFHVSSNDGAFGAFDDVVIQVEKHNQNTIKFAVQLKYSNKTKSLILKRLSARTGNYSIIKYFESFLECKEATSGYKLVLSTTCKLNFSNGIKIQLEDDEIFYVEILRCGESTTLLSTTNLNHCYKFQIVKDITICPFTEKMKEYEDFFERFYLCTKEKNVDQIKFDVSKQLQKEFNCDESIFNTYIAFINEWSIREDKKEMLNKRMMAKFLTLSLLSRSMYPYSFGNSVGENAEILQKAIAKFTVTVFDANSLEAVKRVWSDAKEKLKKKGIKDVNRIRRLYEPNWQYADDLNKLDGKDCSKFLWYTDDEEYPLIVEESSLTYKAISLCSEKKYVILRRETSSMASNQFTIWETLSDLQVHPEVYEDLTQKFKCQLPGQAVTLKDLVTENRKFAEVITTDELMKMVEHPYVVNEQVNEKLPEPYVTRFLSGNFIDLEYLEYVEDHTFVVLSNVREEDLTKYSNRKNLYIIKEKCCQEEFTKICERTKGITNFYLFLMIDENLQLIRSKGDISCLLKFHIGSIEETVFYNPYNLNNVNIVTCEPGIGKSVFLRALKNNLSAQMWNIILTPNDMGAICRQFRNAVPFQRDQIQDFILEMKHPDYNEFQKSVVKLLMVKGRICYSWDALDEITNENLMFIVEVIHSFSDCVQWLTSRRHLKKHLEEEFDVLSTSISPFDDQQQTRYIQVRLETITLDSEADIIEEIKRIVAFTANTNVLGIPLQIFMLTELFRQDKYKIVNLISKHLFSLSDLYQYFVDEKFNFFYKKTGEDICQNDLLRPILDSDKVKRIENYQRLALDLLFNVEFLTHTNIKSHSRGDFVIELRQGDQFGLITTDDQNIQFVHISYAEYFAASYFAEHYKEDLGLENIISDERYNNVRFFLDCLLARNSPPHVAVLCKNLELLKQYGENLDDYKDLAGRNLLHLAASWGERYQLFDVQKSYNFTSIITSDYNIMDGATSEEEMLKYLLERCDVKAVDDLFNLDCLAYAEKFECLLNLVIIENSEKTGYLNLKNYRFASNILFYSTYFGYEEIFEIYMKYAVKLKIRTKYSSITLLHFASIKGHCKVVHWLINSGANIEAGDTEKYTPLHWASKNGQFKAAKLLINSGANIEAVNYLKYTPLHYASENGQLEATQLLINSGANIEAVNYYLKYTPLHYASENGHFQVVQLLINSGANINAVDRYTRTPLHFASENGHFEVVRLLINSRANIETIDVDVCTALHIASQNGQFEVAQLLINSGANIEAVGWKGYTPLHYASENGHFEVVQLLINSGANLEADNKEGFTPLHCTSENGELGVAQLLIESGANIEAVNHDWKCTPLHYASSKGHFELVQFLINSGANIDAVDRYTGTPLHYASINGRLEVVQLLINSGANIEAVNTFDFTPLHYAADNGKFEVAQLLIISGANIEAIDTYGDTPLHRASEKGQFEIAQLLIHSGSNIEAVNKKFCRTPLLYASGSRELEVAQSMVNWVEDSDNYTLQNRLLKVIQLLIQYGANIDAVDIYTGTPLHYVSENGHFEAVQLLINSRANIEAIDLMGCTPLHRASENGHFEVVQLLINSGANIKAVDVEAWTPLHCASRNREFGVAQLLIQSGANIEAVDYVRRTPLHYASMNESYEVAELLIKAGANVETVDENGFTPLHCASENGRFEVTQLLIVSGANIEAVDERGFPPLHYALNMKRSSVARFLISRGAKSEPSSNLTCRRCIVL